MPSFLTFLLGLAALIIGASLLIRGGSSLAFRAGISPFIIGITLVAFGTSSPELAVAIQSAVSGEGTLSVGNLIGANIIGLLLILGLLGTIRPSRIPGQGLRLHLPMMVLSSGAVFLLLQDGDLNQLDGALLIAVAATYLLLIGGALRRGAIGRSSAPEADADDAEPQHDPIGVSILRLLAGLAILVLASGVTVSAAVELANNLGVSNTIIGLTIVALGTSSPELTTAVMASIRRERQLALGNIFGSVIFNNSLMLGVTGALSANRVLLDLTTVRVDLPVLLAASVLAIPILVSGRRIVRFEGIALIAAYIAFLSFVILVQAQL